MEYIKQAVESGKISGNGLFTQKCHQYFSDHFGFGKCLLTSSCTDALEMAAILCGIGPGDEVIMPSYTFVSTANAFVLRGAKIVFADSRKDHPGMDESQLGNLITSATKVIVVVHYAGVACDMDLIMDLAHRHNLFVVEDAAHSINSFFTDRKGKKTPLGGIGHLAAFSFHETKNVISGEGGMLVINDDQFVERAEIVWDKGTNRSAFFKGEVDKYGWVDIGSSFLSSEITAAFLFAQLEALQRIQKRRLHIWNRYHEGLKALEDRNAVRLPFLPDYATNNGHMYYVVTDSLAHRDGLIKHLRTRGVHSVFHYQSLHLSKYFKDKHDGRPLDFSDFYSETLVRLPLFFELSDAQVDYIVENVLGYFSERGVI